MDNLVTVEITYSPQPWDVGQIIEIPADEARLLIREGRAREHYPDTPVEPLPVPEPVLPQRPRRPKPGKPSGD